MPRIKKNKAKTSKRSSDFRKSAAIKKSPGKPSPPKKIEKKERNPEEGVVKRTAYTKAVRAALLTSADVRQKLISMGGENTINVIREFDKDMSDEDLSRKTGIKASDVRVVLNRLHNYGLFSYTRTRDKDSGWYSYIWKMSMERLTEYFGGEVEAEKGERTVDGGEDKYRCAACSPEKLVDFEDAVDLKFRCDACGSPLEFFENKKK